MRDKKISWYSKDFLAAPVMKAEIPLYKYRLLAAYVID